MSNCVALVRAVVLCAGSGSRTGLSYNKILHTVGHKSVLEMTLDGLYGIGVDSITVVISPRDENNVRKITSDCPNLSLCYGGDTRTESARNGLLSLEPCDIVIIQDGARPYTSGETYLRSVASAVSYGSGIAAVPATDTVRMKESDGSSVLIPRDRLYNLQTPQTFRYAEILSAYKSFKGVATDDSAVYEAAGYKCRLIEGSTSNVKITSKEDLFSLGGDLKVGVGFDVHELREGRELILGGVHIPHLLGLYGHSDADVLVHAIMDALLSAAGLPDIGVLFPDTDPRFEGANSMKLLEKIYAEIKKLGFKVGNISAVVMAQKPKLAGHIPAMRDNLARALSADISRVNVSATTTEHLGIVGEERGMAASATAIIQKEEA